MLWWELKTWIIEKCWVVVVLWCCFRGLELRLKQRCNFLDKMLSQRYSMAVAVVSGYAFTTPSNPSPVVETLRTIAIRRRAPTNLHSHPGLRRNSRHHPLPSSYHVTTMGTMCLNITKESSQSTRLTANNQKCSFALKIVITVRFYNNTIAMLAFLNHPTSLFFGHLLRPLIIPIIIIQVSLPGIMLNLHPTSAILLTLSVIIALHHRTIIHLAILRWRARVILSFDC